MDAAASAEDAVAIVAVLVAADAHPAPVALGAEADASKAVTASRTLTN